MSLYNILKDIPVSSVITTLLEELVKVIYSDEIKQIKEIACKINN